jgi:hypothetical protein
MFRTRHAVGVLSLCLLLFPALARAADTATSTPDNGKTDTFIYVVIAAVYAAVFIVFATVSRILGASSSKWSLADALSEEADLTVDDGTGKPMMAAGAAVNKSELRASSSRLIAFVGTVAILLLFLGFGAFMLWDYAKTGTIRNANDVRSYLMAGLTLFAPYVVNKFSSVFAPK